MSDTEPSKEAQNEEPKADESIPEDKEEPEDAAETGDSKTGDDDEAKPKNVNANGDNDAVDDAEPKKEGEEDEEKNEKEKEVKEEKDEEEDDEEEDDEDEEEEQKVGLLEQPIVLEEGSKRQRKKVERMSFQSPEAEREKIEIKEGKGTALGDIPIIEFKLRRIKPADAKPLHKVLFKRVGGPLEIKKNIKKFSGFSFEKGDTEYDKRMQMLRAKSFTKSMISKICEILDVQRSGSKEEVSERLLDFLLEPKDSGKKVPVKKKGKGGGKVKGKGKQKKKRKSKAKDSDGSDDDKDEEEEEAQEDESDEKDDDEDDNESEESEEEPPKKKRKTLPKPKPKEKKAPAKKPAPKKKAASKKKVESDDDDDVSDVSSDSDDDKPIEKTKHKSTPPTNDELKEVIKKMLDSANLEEVTMKSVLKDVEAVPLTEISFEKPRLNKQQQKKTVCKRISPRKLQTEDPTELLQSLRQSSPNAVILTVTNPKSAPRRKPTLPLNLLTLHKNPLLDGEDLKTACDVEMKKLSVLPEQCAALEKATREQSKSRLWKEYRAGRLTASNFYDICHTKRDNPSKSLLMKIMNYSTFTSSATTWGLKNEERAKNMYVDLAKTRHTNFEFVKCGLVIDPKFPYFGCTPDGYVTCDCCGKGTVEIKCPFKSKDTHPCSVEDKTFYLPKHDQKGIYCENFLPMEHRYSYQIQGQMGISECLYCDFVCFTNRGVHIERIFFNEIFFKQMLQKLTPFFKMNILPEILTGKLKSSLTECSLSESACFCGRNGHFGEMVTCDSEHCKIKNYHMTCVGLVVAPKGHWYCLTCLNPKKRRIENLY